MVFLEISSLTKKFENFYAIRDISFSVEKGEILGILGPSGCGKTTILKIILGLLVPTSGDIFIEGNSIINIPTESRGFGYIPQNLALFPHLTVFENIAFGLKTKKWKQQDITKKVNSLLNMLDIDELQKKLPHEISGGQQQRVALARALAPNPSLLLMDEPLSSLDTSLSFHLRWEIKKVLKKTSTTAIFVTHDPEEAISICDRLILMEEGRSIQTTTSREILKSPASFKVLQILGKSNIFPIKEKRIKQDGKIWLVTPLGELPYSSENSNNMILGCWIPETDIKINKNDFAKENELVIKGELIGTIWGRTKNRLIIELADRSQIIVQQSSNNKNLPTVGEKVTLSIFPNKIRWF